MKGRRPPPPISAAYLQRVTAWYLERWATSGNHLRRLLMTRVKRSAAHHGTDPDEAVPLVDAEIARLEAAGLLDDAQYAADKVRALRRRGASAAKVRATLSAKGLGAEGSRRRWPSRTRTATTPSCAPPRPTPAATGSGPGAAGADDPDKRRKELGKLGRAGFPFDVARKVVDAEDPEALEAG
ncbi:MAG: RecX family transcriptional regulator [Myxococcota bacterium]